MGTIALTGSASGIGAATRTRLEAAGHRVVGVDVRGADVTADLSTPDGRAHAVAEVRRLADDRLDGLVACAGVGPHTDVRPTIVSVNYFAAIATLDGLRDALTRGTQPAAVAVSSNSATVSPPDDALLNACLDGDEPLARARAESLHGSQVYGSSKLALARWVRREATGAGWAGRGIRLNAVAPGAVQTPLLQGTLDDPILGPAVRGFPIPLGGLGTADHIAAVIAFLLGPDAAFCCGSVLFADGGSDALLRADRV